ncbi:hypothetical protein AOQ84DRAFT_99653 [Glonium stellatum]|uniref:Secreted protein n=1 Tax=Glonium stellatum TaxID=574774 RepID=A0A8E2JPZ1_9PEZI|nr:hypothetical protein AOQ84DRAFT_99653 [Glonium stellatum]
MALLPRCFCFCFCFCCCCYCCYSWLLLPPLRTGTSPTLTSTSLNITALLSHSLGFHHTLPLSNYLAIISSNPLEQPSRTILSLHSTPQQPSLASSNLPEHRSSGPLQTISIVVQHSPRSFPPRSTLGSRSIIHSHSSAAARRSPMLPCIKLLDSLPDARSPVLPAYSPPCPLLQQRCKLPCCSLHHPACYQMSCFQHSPHSQR